MSFKAQMERCGWPRLRALREGDGEDEVLLIDASSVIFHCARETTSFGLGGGFAADATTAAAAAPDQEEVLYGRVLQYASRLVKTGLRCVAVLDGPEGVRNGKRRARQPGEVDVLEPPSLYAVALHALVDAGVELTQAKTSSLGPLLALSMQLRRKLFAVLTSDTELFVYDTIERLCFVSDAVVAAEGVTFVVWDSQEAWGRWKGSLGELPPAAQIWRGQCPLPQRATVAALMKPANSNPARSIPWAASAALRLVPDEPLAVDWFQTTLGLRRFDDAALASVQASVQAYIDESKQATEPLETLTEEAVPGSRPAGIAPDPKATLAALAEADERAAAAAVAEALENVDLETSNLVDVGSGLNSQDWADFDAKDIVARARGGASYKIMQILEPLPMMGGGGLGAAVPALERDVVFEYFYVQRKEGRALYKELMGTVFKEEYDLISKDKKAKKATDAKTPQQILDEAVAERGEPGKATVQWLRAVDRGQPEDLLALRRAARRVGPGSVEAAVGEALWCTAKDVAREQAESKSFLCSNRGTAYGPPRRYPHQQQVYELLEQHLRGMTSPVVSDRPLPLHIILNTPTGSGKTFTAIMLQLQLLANLDADPGPIILYSVPTKQVLKRVGQECEAHKIVYWTASAAGDEFLVRRPYSIRTQRNRKEKTKGKDGEMKEEKTAGTSSPLIMDQLHEKAHLGRVNYDRGGGKPEIIVADVFAASSMLHAARKEPKNSPFHIDNIIVYFDEPNMGIRLNPLVLKAAQGIMASRPASCVLASATLPPWPLLPSWWTGGGAAAQRLTITQEPYELPLSTLSLLDMDRRELRPVSVLELFENPAELEQSLNTRPITGVLLLRHLTMEHGLALQAAASSSARGEEAVDAWATLHGEVRELRQSLEPIFRNLSEDTEVFDALRQQWAAKNEARVQPASGLRGALSKNSGITMVATLNPRKAALELAGWRNENGEVTETWTNAKHALRGRWKEAERVAKAAEKEAGRSRAKTEDDAPPGADEATTGSFTIRKGVTVMLNEDIDEDSLVMLSQGVAYACGDGSEGPVVKRLYQQALLHIPEDGVGRGGMVPPINVLVVDYSSIYGTDCPAVDTVVLIDDLGELLSWEDHQQFIGRLRRDGSAVFCSDRTLRAATNGLGPRPPSAVATVAAEGAAAATPERLQECGATAQQLLTAVLDLAPAEDAASMTEHVKAWAAPLQSLVQEGAKRHAAFLRGAEGTLVRKATLASVGAVLEGLLAGGVVSNAAVLDWWTGAKKRGKAANALDARAAELASKASALGKRLKAEAEAEEEEEEEEEEDPLVVELREFASKHTPEETAAKLRSLKTQGKQHELYILVEALLDAEKGQLPKQLKARLPFFAALLAGEPEGAERGKAQLALLAALEQLIAGAEEPAKLAKELPALLNLAYDEDVLEEGPVVHWHKTQASAKKLGVEPAAAAAIRSAAQPFIDWLAEAEEDDD